MVNYDRRWPLQRLLALSSFRFLLMCTILGLSIGMFSEDISTTRTSTSSTGEIVYATYYNRIMLGGMVGSFLM
jgi:hypothetical protein